MLRSLMLLLLLLLLLRGNAPSLGGPADKLDNVDPDNQICHIGFASCQAHEMSQELGRDGKEGVGSLGVQQVCGACF
jgi:hypothetical protein